MILTKRAFAPKILISSLALLTIGAGMIGGSIYVGVTQDKDKQENHQNDNIDKPNTDNQEVPKPEQDNQTKPQGSIEEVTIDDQGFGHEYEEGMELQLEAVVNGGDLSGIDPSKLQYQ